MNASRRRGQRKQVAREAAELLYTEQEKEFKQAKVRASRTMGVHILPSNIEVALELDTIAEEREGEARGRRLMALRNEALQIMETLADHNPRLVGSVWRGTAHHHSDIDIVAFAKDPQHIVSLLKKHNYRIAEIEAQATTQSGQRKQSLHIHVDLPSKHRAEIVVRKPEESAHPPKCEIYGDAARGLTTPELRKILRSNPGQKFVPM